jgi:hypothetical protein
VALAVVLALLVIAIVVVVAWLWRRGWILPCAGGGNLKQTVKRLTTPNYAHKLIVVK